MNHLLKNFILLVFLSQILSLTPKALNKKRKIHPIHKRHGNELHRRKKLQEKRNRSRKLHKKMYENNMAAITPENQMQKLETAKNATLEVYNITTIKNIAKEKASLLSNEIYDANEEIDEMTLNALKSLKMIIIPATCNLAFNANPMAITESTKNTDETTSREVQNQEIVDLNLSEIITQLDDDKISNTLTYIKENFDSLVKKLFILCAKEVTTAKVSMLSLKGLKELIWASSWESKLELRKPMAKESMLFETLVNSIPTIEGGQKNDLTVAEFILFSLTTFPDEMKTTAINFEKSKFLKDLVIVISATPSSSEEELERFNSIYKESNKKALQMIFKSLGKELSLRNIILAKNLQATPFSAGLISLLILTGGLAGTAALAEGAILSKAAYNSYQKGEGVTPGITRKLAEQKQDVKQLYNAAKDTSSRYAATVSKKAKSGYEYLKDKITASKQNKEVKETPKKEIEIDIKEVKETPKTEIKFDIKEEKETPEKEIEIENMFA